MATAITTGQIKNAAAIGSGDTYTFTASGGETIQIRSRDANVKVVSVVSAADDWRYTEAELSGQDQAYSQAAPAGVDFEFVVTPHSTGNPAFAFYTV